MESNRFRTVIVVFPMILLMSLIMGIFVVTRLTSLSIYHSDSTNNAIGWLKKVSVELAWNVDRNENWVKTPRADNFQQGDIGFTNLSQERDRTLKQTRADNVLHMSQIDTATVYTVRNGKPRLSSFHGGPALRPLRPFERNALALAIKTETIQTRSTKFSAVTNALTSTTFVPMFRNGELRAVILVSSSLAKSGGALISYFNNIVMFTAMIVTAAGFFLVLFLLSTMRRRARETAEFEYLQRYDGLTKLPNRKLFLERLNEVIEQTSHGAKPLAILIIDIDRFKEINETLGYKYGDELLRKFANRLSYQLRNAHTIARLSADEFAIIMQDAGDYLSVAKDIEVLLANIGNTYRMKDTEVDVTHSLGIAFASKDTPDADLLLKNADLALNRAKDDGRDTYRFFEAEMDLARQGQLGLARDMRTALRDNDFILYYQPQHNLKDDSLAGYEALIRWQHKEKGFISPDDFIPLAEESGHIVQIGEWVLREACREAVTWKRPYRIAVNLSVVQFEKQDIASLVESVLFDTGLDPERLELEVTESLFIANTDAVVATLERIRALGVRVALDDFGTGYSSLSYLSRFPYNKIKIDRSFVAKMFIEDSAQAIISAIIGLGRTLGVTVTAEGIETEEEAKLLRIAGCQEAQGYFYGKPRDLSKEPGLEQVPYIEEISRAG